jgi:hypothetical protein
MGVILILAGITYYLVQTRNLLMLYSLATLTVVVLMIVVAFDLGLGKSGGTPIEEDLEETPAPVIEQAPKASRRKKRR